MIMLITAFLFFQVCTIVSTISTVQASSRLSLDLSKNVSYLRGEDDRLVRYNVPDEDSQYRQKEICTTKYLEAVMDTFSNLTSSIDSSFSEPTYRKIGLCLQILTLCATNNHGTRNRIGQYKDGDTLGHIVKMIHHPFTQTFPPSSETTLLDIALRTSAYASESVWILSFNSPNHDVFVDADGVMALRSVIVSAYHSPSINVAKMWALAALQNLAASYCHSPTGHCRWYYDQETYTVKLHLKTPLFIDGNKARVQIANDVELMHSITNLTCHSSSSSSGPHSEVNPWPTLATKRDALHELHENMPTWAAVGAVKNIILNHDAWADILPVKDCICDLKYSTDWLVGV